jgi:hypothetical protein
MERVDYAGMIVLHGDLFEFDAERRYLIDHEQKQNRYDLSALNRKGSFLTGLYYLNNRKIMSKPEDVVYPNGHRQPYPFYIPVSLIHKGERLSDRIIQHLNDTSLKMRHGFHYVDQALCDRLNGDLPKVDIYGHTYLLNIGEREMFQQDNPENKIRFTYRAMFESSEIFYNKSTNTQVNVSSMMLFPNLKELNSDVECILLPPLQDMDIIGYMQLSEMKPTAMVCEMPWKLDQGKIHMLKLGEVDISGMMLKNLRQQSTIKNYPA